MFEGIAKFIIATGVLMVVAGVILWFYGKIPFIGKLPGDILIKRGNFTFYAPIATSIIVSVILSIILMLFNYLRR